MYCFNLQMQHIDHLPPEEKHYFIRCSCGEYVDQRNLSEISNHLHSKIREHRNWIDATHTCDPAAFPIPGKRMDLN